MEASLTFIDAYKVLAMVGDGGQANVYLCSDNLKLYAIKVFNAGMSKGEAFNRQTKFLSLLQEHHNLIKMHHANAEAVITNVDGTQTKKSIIVLQYAQNGDLFEYISITKGFKPEFCRAIFQKMLSGIQHLNQLGIAHRDLKPENILFNQNFQLKISDFGLSTLSQGADKDFILTTRVGTEGFKAPEVDSGSYNGQKADIFAIGVILFVIYTGSPPFMSTKSSDKIYKYIINKNFEKFWSIHEKNRPKGFYPASFKTLLNSLLTNNPEDRPTIDQIRENQWLNLQTASKQSLQSELHLRYQKIMQQSENKAKIRQIVEKNKKVVFVEQKFGKQEGISELQTDISENSKIQSVFAE